MSTTNLPNTKIFCLTRPAFQRLACYYPVSTVKFYGQAERAISNSQLNVLLRLHTCPIKLVVFQCPSNFRWEISSWGRFRAYMHSALILTELRYPAMPLAGQLEHKRFVHPGPLVLRASPLKSPTPLSLIHI